MLGLRKEIALAGAIAAKLALQISSTAAKRDC